MIEAKLGPCGVQRRCERECSQTAAKQEGNGTIAESSLVMSGQTASIVSATDCFRWPSELNHIQSCRPDTSKG